MASPLTVYAQHPNFHIFRDRSSFPEGYQDLQLQEGAMRAHHTQPYYQYRRERSNSPSFQGNPTTSRESYSSRYETRPLSRGMPSIHTQSPGYPLQSAPSQNSSVAANGQRVGVDQLLDGYTDSRSSVPRPYSHTPAHAPISPPRGASDQREGARLPGIGSLLSMSQDTPRPDTHLRYAAPPSAPSHGPPQHPGHSAASSLSSVYSEPVSPNSFGVPSTRSPLRTAGDDRGRTQPQYRYPHREEMFSSGPHHDHAPGLPSIPAPPTHQPHSSNYPPPPPPPSGPNTLLPPPPDPYYQNAPYAHRNSSMAFHPPPPGSTWDRSRVDSAMPSYEQSMQGQTGYGWPYAGHHATSSMTRKRRGNLPKEATKVLKDWFTHHHDSPYPTEDEKQDLCRKTGLQISQVNNWFINARRRLPRQDAQKMYEKEAQDRADTVDSVDSDMPYDGKIDPRIPYP